MLVMALPSRARDGTAESVLVIAHQGTAADHQGAIAVCQGAIIGHHGVTVDRQGATADRQCAITSCQYVIDLATLRPKKALATRCVDGGGHQSRRMDLHVSPTVGANCRDF
jgi:hypothetical protein